MDVALCARDAALSLSPWMLQGIASVLNHGGGIFCLVSAENSGSLVLVDPTQHCLLQ